LLGGIEARRPLAGLPRLLLLVTPGGVRVIDVTADLVMSGP
jgi:hypothetical protein